MNSWAMLLLVDMDRGKYLNLSPRPVNPWDWVLLWGLIQTEPMVTPDSAADTVKT